MQLYPHQRPPLNQKQTINLYTYNAEEHHGQRRSLCLSQNRMTTPTRWRRHDIYRSTRKKAGWCIGQHPLGSQPCVWPGQDSEAGVQEKKSHTSDQKTLLCRLNADRRASW